jgi:hypothetical protein
VDRQRGVDGGQQRRRERVGGKRHARACRKWLRVHGSSSAADPRVRAAPCWCKAARQWVVVGVVLVQGGKAVGRLRAALCALRAAAATTDAAGR